MKFLAALKALLAAIDKALGYPFERPDSRVRRLRAELADLDSWIPCLERHIDELRAQRRALQVELFEDDSPDVRARQMEGQ